MDSSGDVQVRGCLNLAGATIKINISDTSADGSAVYPQEKTLNLIRVPGDCINGEPTKVQVNMINNDCVVASNPHLDLSARSSLIYLVQLDANPDSSSDCGINDAQVEAPSRWSILALLLIAMTLAEAMVRS